MTAYCVRCTREFVTDMQAGLISVHGCRLIEPAEIASDNPVAYAWWVVEDDNAPPELHGKLVDTAMFESRQGVWHITSYDVLTSYDPRTPATTAIQRVPVKQCAVCGALHWLN